jgi:hypothetical protein
MAIDLKTRKTRQKIRGNPAEGLKEPLGPPLITRVPAEDILYWNQLSKRYDLGFQDGTDLASSVMTEFSAAAPWANPAVRDNWAWLKSKMVTHTSRRTGIQAGTGYAQFNLRLPVSEREALKALVERLKGTNPDLSVSSFVATAVHWATHFRYPRGGPVTVEQRPYTPADFAVSDPLIEIPAMHVTEGKARKLLVALGDTAPVATFEVPRRLVLALQAK